MDSALSALILRIQTISTDRDTLKLCAAAAVELVNLMTALSNIVNGNYDNAHSPEGAAKVARAALEEFNK